MNPLLECIVPWKVFNIDDPDGTVVPCCRDWIKINCGNVCSDTIEEVWNGENYQLIRQKIIEGRIYDVCEKHCPKRFSEQANERNLKIITGSNKFVENQKLNNKEIKERKTVLRSKPMMFQINPTFKCNLRCLMCSQDHLYPKELPLHVYNDIQNYYDYIYEIHLLGGEFILSKTCLDFLLSFDYRKFPDIRFCIITNGTLFTKQLLDRLKFCRISYIIVSINAATEKTYKTVTGGKFNNVMENIKNMIAFSKHHHYPFEIFLSFVVMKSNYQEVPIFTQMCAELGLELKLLPIFGNHNNQTIFTELETMKDIINELNCAETIAIESKLRSTDEIRWVKNVVETKINELKGKELNGIIPGRIYED